jgi:predicted transcriptional regulator
MNAPLDIPTEVREARRRLGLSQRELAEVAGVSLASICRLEQGRLPRVRSRVLGRVRAAIADLEAATTITPTSERNR